MRASVLFTKGELVNHCWRWGSKSVPTHLRGSWSGSAPAEGAVHAPHTASEISASQTEPAITGSKKKWLHSTFMPLWGPEDDYDVFLIPTTRGKSDENQLGVSKKPSPNKWIKRKAAPLIATSDVCLVDTGIWWVVIVAIQRWFTSHVITRVPSPGPPQEESAPKAPRREELQCWNSRYLAQVWNCIRVAVVVILKLNQEETHRRILEIVCQKYVRTDARHDDFLKKTLVDVRLRSNVFHMWEAHMQNPCVFTKEVSY